MIHFKEKLDLKKTPLDFLPFKDIKNQLDFSRMTTTLTKKIIPEEYLYPKSLEYQEKVRTITNEDLQVTYNDNCQQTLAQFGRLFLLFDLLPPDQLQVFISNCKKLDEINQALVNDLEDHIIVQGLKPIGEDYMIDRHNAREQFNFLNQLAKEEVQQEIQKVRPPFLWNAPDTLNKEHSIRFSSNIHTEHLDKSISAIYLVIENLSV